jgi:hypothetical protein
VIGRPSSMASRRTDSGNRGVDRGLVIPLFYHVLRAPKVKLPPQRDGRHPSAAVLALPDAGRATTGRYGIGRQPRSPARLACGRSKTAEGGLPGAHREVAPASDRPTPRAGCASCEKRCRPHYGRSWSSAVASRTSTGCRTRRRSGGFRVSVQAMSGIHTRSRATMIRNGIVILPAVIVPSSITGDAGPWGGIGGPFGHCRQSRPAAGPRGPARKAGGGRETLCPGRAAIRPRCGRRALR